MTVEARKIAPIVLIAGSMFLMLNMALGLGYDGLAWVLFAAAWLVATVLWKHRDPR